MRRWLMLALLTALAVPAAAQDTEKTVTTGKVVWTHYGLPQLPAALAEARRAGKRVMVGLSGSFR